MKVIMSILLKPNWSWFFSHQVKVNMSIRSWAWVSCMTYACIRLDCSSSNGLKTIVPIRPIGCLSGVLDLQEAHVRIFWVGFFCCLAGSERVTQQHWATIKSRRIDRYLSSVCQLGPFTMTTILPNLCLGCVDCSATNRQSLYWCRCLNAN